jgi:hypothetical protein
MEWPDALRSYKDSLRILQARVVHVRVSQIDEFHSRTMVVSLVTRVQIESGLFAEDGFAQRGLWALIERPYSKDGRCL